MERKLEDLVSYLKTKIEKREKELDHIRKVNNSSIISEIHLKVSLKKIIYFLSD